MPVMAIYGATGFVGAGLVNAALEAGWEVYAVARGPQALARAASRWPRSEKLHQMIAPHPGPLAIAPVDLAVSAVGKWSSGTKLMDLPYADAAAGVQANLSAQVAAVQTVGASLKPGANYAVINGEAARQVWPGSAIACAAGAGVSRLVEVLRAEDPPFAATDVILTLPVAGDSRNVPEPGQRYVEISTVWAALKHLCELQPAPAVLEVDELGPRLPN